MAFLQQINHNNNRDRNINSNLITTTKNNSNNHQFNTNSRRVIPLTTMMKSQQQQQQHSQGLNANIVPTNNNDNNNFHNQNKSLQEKYPLTYAWIAQEDALLTKNLRVFKRRLFTLFILLFATVIFNSTLYDGWRHFYFTYSFISIIASYGLIHFYENFTSSACRTLAKIAFSCSHNYFLHI